MRQTCVYCNHGKCNSCNGSMRCSKCSGKGTVTRTEGGTAKYKGEAIAQANNTTTSNTISYDKIKDTYWQGDSYIKVDDKENVIESGSYSNGAFVGLAFSNNLCDASKSPLLKGMIFQQTGSYPPAGYTIPNIYEFYYRLDNAALVFPIQIKDGCLSFDLVPAITIQSVEEENIIVHIETDVSSGYITMKKTTKESFFDGLVLYEYR